MRRLVAVLLVAASACAAQPRELRRVERHGVEWRVVRKVEGGRECIEVSAAKETWRDCGRITEPGEAGRRYDGELDDVDGKTFAFSLGIAPAYPDGTFAVQVVMQDGTTHVDDEPRRLAWFVVYPKTDVLPQAVWIVDERDTILFEEVLNELPATPAPSP